MAFIRTKQIKGKIYYYLVKSVREGNKVRQVILKYLGTTPPEQTGEEILMEIGERNDHVTVEDVKKHLPTSDEIQNGKKGNKQ